MRLPITALLAMVAFLAGASPGSTANAPPNAGGETVRIQLISGLLLSLPLYTATDKGFFAAVGIKPELVSLATGPLGVQALASNSIDVADTGTEVFMNAYAKQVDIQLIAGLVKTNTFTVEVNKSVALPHLKDGYPAIMEDLKGIVFGVSALGSSGQLFANALFADAKLDPTTVQFLAVGSSVTAYPALTEGKIQAYMATEPMQTLCKMQNTCVAVLDLRKGEGASEIAETNGASLTFAVQRSYINTHPVVVKAFIQAISDANRWMRDPKNFAELLALTKSRINLGTFPDPDALLASMLKDNGQYFGETISRKAIVNLSRFLVKYKQIPQEIDPEKFVYADAPQPAP